MAEEQNGAIYLGQEAAKHGYRVNRPTLDGDHTIESDENAMIAGPISITDTITVIGTLAVV
jgi:hypothetical protein